MITSAYMETLCLILKFVFRNSFELQRQRGRVKAGFPFMLVYRGRQRQKALTYFYDALGKDPKYKHRQLNPFLKHQLEKLL